MVGYDVFQNGVWVLSTPASNANTPTVVVTGLLPNTPYNFAVDARDASGNVSDPITTTLTTLASNGILPTPPGNLTATASFYSGVTLSWNGSQDGLWISAYDVYEGSTKILTVDGSTTSVLVGGLYPATQYTFTVRARDPQGNVSMSSNTAIALMPTLPPEGAISNPNGSFNPNWLRYSADFNLAFGFQHVFIDSDNNVATGWATSSNPPVGADYMIENDTVYRYAGSGTDWTWTIVDTISPKIKGYTAEWKVPVSDLTNPATTQAVVFGGNGFAPTAYSLVITLNQ